MEHRADLPISVSSRYFLVCKVGHVSKPLCCGTLPTPIHPGRRKQIKTVWNFRIELGERFRQDRWIGHCGRAQHGAKSFSQAEIESDDPQDKSYENQLPNKAGGEEIGGTGGDVCELDVKRIEEIEDNARADGFTPNRKTSHEPRHVKEDGL